MNIIIIIIIIIIIMISAARQDPLGHREVQEYPDHPEMTTAFPDHQENPELTARQEHQELLVLQDCQVQEIFLYYIIAKH